MQNDFCEGGALPAAGADHLAWALAAFAAANTARFDLLVATRDEHVDPGGHFAAAGAQPDFVNTWPVHCVRGSHGARFHPALANVAFDTVVTKGAFAASTNGFDGADADDTPLGELLRRKGITDVYIAGLVYEICDAATALGAIAEGFSAHLITDLCVAIDERNIPDVNRRLEEAGVAVVTAAQAVARVA